MKRYMLTFLRPTSERRSGGRIVWEARCECGSITCVIPSAVNVGMKKSCGCLYASTRSTISRKYDPRISSARCVWREVYNKECDFELFYSLSQQVCYYCGAPPSNRYNRAKAAARSKVSSNYQRDNGTFIYNGVDRVDNTKGHTHDNIVSCCKRCNIAKNNMTLGEFLEWIERLYTHTRTIH